MFMKRRHIFLLGALTIGAAFTSCKKEGCTDPTASNYNAEADKDDNSCTYPSATTKQLTLNITGLEDLGANHKYETWIIVNGSPVSIGTFDVDASGAMSTTTFTGSASDIDDASMFVLSIEPFPDTDPNPSDVKILGGAFNGNTADLVVSHAAALGSDFSSAAGDYIIATPTTNSTTDDLSGVWFFNPGAATPEMMLPTLPAGWEYEGWAVIGGTPVSTGKFTDPAMADDAATFSGTDNAGPSYPGEDFIMNAPAGLSFPTDLSGQTMVISIEPVPDNSPAPFLLKPLVGTVPATASAMTPYTFGNNAAATNPTGTATR
jgi:hypothetical protein